ncbi:anti-sigma factor [Sinomonas atrocyanea]|uniref:anti-sigma factor n=1 Tax=Sinomonas atrocyanea TaxID=37927 RepID=UPI0027811D7F|nr:anti-sigma factor [Sinomonas atrocyanea]MDQ0261595.1 anti-sigma-K factor RskA [Sinomonas atrocyanea]MDR6621546.1 anti-sigma-K factor RskA [Sinomonas atrocyanea]
MDDQLHLLTGAYALNALDDEERRRFEHTLGFGDETAEEARELAETAALLAAGTTPVAPPPDLKARLMAQIAVTPQFDAVEEPRPAAAVEGSRPSVEGSHPSVEGSHPYSPAPPAGATVADLGEHRRRASRLPVSTRWLAAAAAALLVVAGVSGAWAIHAQQQRDDALRQLALAADAPGAVMGRILAAPDAKVQEVRVPGGGTLVLAHSRQDAVAGVVTLGLPQPSQGHVYELWLGDSSGSMKPAGLVQGTGTTWNELAGGIGSATVLGVTVEPAGGSKQPTTAPIVVQQFS